jgi:chromosome segregation ATPase
MSTSSSIDDPLSHRKTHDLHPSPPELRPKILELKRTAHEAEEKFNREREKVVELQRTAHESEEKFNRERDKAVELQRTADEAEQKLQQAKDTIKHLERKKVQMDPHDESPPTETDVKLASYFIETYQGQLNKAFNEWIKMGSQGVRRNFIDIIKQNRALFKQSYHM